MGGKDRMGTKAKKRRTRDECGDGRSQGPPVVTTGLEANPNATPELIVVRDAAVGVVEEQPSLAEEIHRMLRMRAQRNAEMEHPRWRKCIAARDIPQ